MSVTCRMHGEGKKGIQDFNGKTLIKRPLDRSRYRRGILLKWILKYTIVTVMLMIGFCSELLRTLSASLKGGKFDQVNSFIFLRRTLLRGFN